MEGAEQAALLPASPTTPGQAILVLPLIEKGRFSGGMGSMYYREGARPVTSYHQVS